MGKLEPDYYHEAMVRRFASSEPSLTHRLLYAPPDKALFGKLTLDQMLGEFKHEPVENGWHTGSLKIVDGKVRWTNQAGISWLLTPDLAQGVLQAGPDCPYYSANPKSCVFRVVLKRNARGQYLPEIAGFQFNGAYYRKLPQ